MPSSEESPSGKGRTRAYSLFITNHHIEYNNENLYVIHLLFDDYLVQCTLNA